MRTVIRADLVIDGKGAAIEKGAVLYEGETILDCGPASRIGTPDGADIIESSGTLLPGLCDVHVHLRTPGTPSEGGGHRLDMIRMSYAEMALRASQYAYNTLKAGFTSVRDCAAPGGVIIDLRNAINGGYVAGPRIKACGLGLTVTGGHMDPPIWADHIHVDDFAAACNGADGFRQGARDQLKRGADFIKLNTWVSYHNSPDRFWRQEMNEVEIAAACEEAHAQGVHVAAHVYGPPGVNASVRNGVDSIEHGHWIDEATIDLMAEKGTRFVPTLTVNDEHARMALANPNLAEKYKRWHRRSSEDKWKTLEMIRKAGVRVCTGTDVGFQIEHGKWNAHELVLLVKGGYSPMEAIIASTANSCDLMEINAGRLEAGRYADMVLLDGNPLDDITLLKKPELMRVFKGGVEIH